MRNAFLVVVLFCNVVWGAEILKNDKNAFQRKEKGYSYSFSIKTSIPQDTVLHLLYDFEHFLEYSSEESDIRLLKNSQFYYDLEFHLKYLMYSGKTIYRRSIDCKNRIVKIKMLFFIHNSSLIPKIVDSYTEYKISSENDHTIIFYEQNVSFEKNISWIVLRMVRGKLNSFESELVKFFSKKEKEEVNSITSSQED